MKRTKMLWFGKMAAMVVVFGTGMGFLLMYLWNWLMPELFGLPLITFWQSVGLLILVKLLLPGLAGRHKHWGHHRKAYWRERCQEKMSKMTPEQRAKFKEGFGKFACDPKTEQHTATGETSEQGA